MNNTIGPSLPLSIDKKNGFLMIDNYVDEIKQNLRILFLTNPGERVWNPGFGLGIRNLLFENPATNVEEIIQTRIRQQVKFYFPFIVINDIGIFSSPDVENLLYVRFDYFIQPLNLQDQLTLSFAG